MSGSDNSVTFVDESKDRFNEFIKTLTVGAFKPTISEFLNGVDTIELATQYNRIKTKYQNKQRAAPVSFSKKLIDTIVHLETHICNKKTYYENRMNEEFKQRISKFLNRSDNVRETFSKIKNMGDYYEWSKITYCHSVLNDGQRNIKVNTFPTYCQFIGGIQTSYALDCLADLIRNENTPKTEGIEVS